MLPMRINAGRGSIQGGFAAHGGNRPTTHAPAWSRAGLTVGIRPPTPPPGRHSERSSSGGSTKSLVRPQPAQLVDTRPPPASQSHPCDAEAEPLNLSVVRQPCTFNVAASQDRVDGTVTGVAPFGSAVSDAWSAISSAMPEPPLYDRTPGRSRQTFLQLPSKKCTTVAGP